MNQNLAKQNWYELSSIQIGGAICLPVILIGYELVRTTGLTSSLVAIIIGNLLLFSCALITSKMSFANKKTTAENAEEYFGKMGKVFFALIITFSLSCWFAIQTEVMSHDLIELLATFTGYKIESSALVSVILSLLMVVSLLFGLQGVTVLATLTLPLMLLTLAISLYCAYTGSSASQPELGSYSFQGLSLILAGNIAAVCDLPTFFRHAATKREAYKASIMTFLIGIPLVELVGVFLGYWTESNSLIKALLCSDHPLFRLWVGLFILLAGWTTNNTNLYSASMGMRAICPKLSEKKITLIIGAFATLLSLLPLLESLSLVLDFMGIFVASMCGVIITAFCMKKFGLHELSQKLAWVMGIVAGLLNMFLGSCFTNIAIVDALIASSFTLILMRVITTLLNKKKVLAYE